MTFNFLPIRAYGLPVWCLHPLAVIFANISIVRATRRLHLECQSRGRLTRQCVEQNNNLGGFGPVLAERPHFQLSERPQVLLATLFAIAFATTRQCTRHRLSEFSRPSQKATSFRACHRVAGNINGYAQGYSICTSNPWQEGVPKSRHLSEMF